MRDNSKQCRRVCDSDCTDMQSVAMLGYANCTAYTVHSPHRRDTDWPALAFVDSDAFTPIVVFVSFT